MMPAEDIKLTSYSHGAGCGCKIAPAVLDRILAGKETHPSMANILVGNSSRDDAAVLDLGNGSALISTTDFFMPIVDDPFTFGRIAGANAISDVYAMGGNPVLAIAILGWPIDKLAPEIAGRVLDGARAVCAEAGIALAGGHSIDSPEPIFGLAVNGLVPVANLKRNSGAEAGDTLYLSKALGVGILSTAEKKGLLREQDRNRAAEVMSRLNSVGAALGGIAGVRAMTDVTGFGLLGHLSEMCRGSKVRARIDFAALPLLPGLDYYLDLQAIPGGAKRNWDSYGHCISPLAEARRFVLCDPQTSGGLLIALAPGAEDAFTAIMEAAGLGAFTQPVGEILPPADDKPLIEVR